MNLADFVYGLLGEVQAMRHGGVSLEDCQRGLRVSLIDYAREHGMIQDERDTPYSQQHRCVVCRDSGWEPTIRMVRGGDTVEAYKRCPCKSLTQKPAPTASDDVARRWK
jgi:hypothetical protein